MREFKVRVYDLDNQKFRYYDHDAGFDNYKFWDIINDVEHGDIQQYTGFKDKNRKEIYEGDICFADGQRKVIIFEDGMFGYATTLGMHCILIPSLMEVIGNIFEQEWMLEVYNLKTR
jgi:hypothetical protein